jgi:N-acetylmuramoyl-L-alanine amidase
MPQIIQDFILAGRGNRPGKMAGSYRSITIHDTDNPNPAANAKMHASYLKSDAAANAPVSWHFTVDDKEIYQHLPLNEHGWHAGDGAKGDGNLTSIAIEICMNADGDRQKAEWNAAWLVAKLWKDRGGRCALYQHNHWSGKNCPSVLRGRPRGWDEFWALVVAHEHTMSTEQAVQDQAWAKLAVAEATIKDLESRLSIAMQQRDEYRNIVRGVQGLVNQVGA